MKSVQNKPFEKVKDHENKLSPLYSCERECRSQGSSPLGRPRRIPPPKPIRTDLLPGGEPLDSSECEKREIYNSARRVSGIVDMDISCLYSQATVIKKKLSTATLPKKSDSKTQKNSSPPSVEPPVGKPRNRSIPVPTLVKPPAKSRAVNVNSRTRLPKSQSMDIVTNSKCESPKITSLIQMFEGKSPGHTPPVRLRSSAQMNCLYPPGEHDARLSKQTSVPSRPPKPQPPPVPPRPLMGSDSESPVIPPRTPAPLLPPKPPGSKPPIVFPRLSHRASLSDFQPAMIPKDITKDSLTLPSK